MTFEIVSKCFYATDFKLKKKHKIEETDQPSLKKYIEEVKQSGMQFFSFSSIIHDTTWIVQTTSFCLTVPVIVPVAQFTQRNQITDSTQEQKSSQHTKKESPVYPPGKWDSHADWI